MRLAERIIKTEATACGGDLLEQRGRVYTFLNPVSYVDALRHKDLFAQFDGIFADGSVLVKAIRLMYGKKVTRRSCDWTSIAKDIFLKSEHTGERIYLIGSKPGEVDKAVGLFKEKCPKAVIAGYHHGYFNNEEERDTAIRTMVAARPDFLFVGMGIIKQEEFLLRAKALGFEGTGFTCGGFIHQTAQTQVGYYPEWIDRWNMRFLYRMYKEPYTRKRYIVGGVFSRFASFGSASSAGNTASFLASKLC